MRIAEHVDVSAPPAIVWEQVSDPSRVLDFFAGVTRWECVGGPRAGLGARYRMLMRVGSAEVGGLIEVVEFDPGRDLAWHSVTGIDQRGAGGVRRRRAGATRVELRIQFGVAGGGIWGWLSEQLRRPDRARERQADARAAQAGGRARAGPRRGGGPARGEGS